MSVLSFPTLFTAPSAASFRLVANTQAFTSPLNRATQTGEMPGARFVCSIEWRGLKAADVRLIKAFLAKLRGMAGRFYLWDVSLEAPAGTAAGTPLVKGANQTGTSLITDGWTAGQTGLLLPGDYFGVNNELKIVTAVAASDGSGNATITFEPPLRSSPADNAVITVTKPTCIMRLADDEQDQLMIEPPLQPGWTLNAVEIF